MSVAMRADPVLVNIKQQATAASKNYRVVTGFRPAMILFWIADSSGNMEPGVLLDTVVDADGTAAHTGAVMNNAASAVNELADLGSDGLTLNDDGFTIGQDGAFKRNGARLLFLCYRSLTPTDTFDLASVEQFKGYGTGDAYKIDAPDSPPVAVYEEA